MPKAALRLSLLVSLALASSTRVARAQEQEQEQEPTLPPIAADSTVVATSDTVEAPDVDASATEIDEPARFEMTSGLGFNFSGYPYAMVRTSFGVPLSERVVFTSGAGFSVSRPGKGSYMLGGQSWGGTVGARIYVRPPRAGGLSPVIQTMLAYEGRHEATAPGTTASWERTVHTLGVRATAGLAYFVTEHLGLLLDAGLQAQQVVGTHQSVGAGVTLGNESFYLNSVVELSLVLRR